MIKEVIKQLPQEKYVAFHDELLSNKGEKFVALLNFYRNENKSDDEIIEDLEISSSSYYTLRSRLFDKIQNFLFLNTSDEGALLMKNVHSLPNFLFDYPKETSIALLTHLEEELIRFDMQTQLILVYSALKKLHINSEKYYQYEQCYNKSVAYMLSQAKAEELLSLFSKSLTSFILSKTDSVKEIMLLYLQEIYNLTLLYDSSRLLLFHKVSYLNYLIFVDKEASVYYTEKTTEDLLNDCQLIIRSSNKHVYYYHFELCTQFLSYHYFHQLKLNKNNNDSLELLMKNSTHLLNLNTLTCPSIFLISLVERYKQEKKPLSDLSDFLNSIGEPDMENEAFYIHYHLCLAIINYDDDKLTDVYTHILNLINFPPLKKHGFIEHEVKLIYVFILLLIEKTDLAEAGLRSLTRKNSISEIYEEQNQLFIQILKAALSNNSNTKQKKIFEAFKLFKILSQAENTILSYLQIQEKHILQLSMN